MRLGPEHARDMSFASGIVGKHHIPGFECSLHAVARFNFPGTGKGHKKLAAWCGMAVNHEPGRSTAKYCAGGRTRVGGEHRLIAAEVELDFLEVGFAIRGRVESDNLHRSSWWNSFSSERREFTAAFAVYPWLDAIFCRRLE